MTVAYSVDRLIVTPRVFTVPLDWSNANDGRQIQVCARIVVASEKKNDNLPYICYFQGGPGFEGASPSSRAGVPYGKVLEKYRVVMLDQRGTGLSTPVDGPTLSSMTTAQQVEYLKHFRQDSIVKDADFVRRQLVGERGKWSIYGQSFGGWCSLTYLSLYPEHLNEVFIFGGFAPIGHGPDEVYRALVQRMRERNESLLATFPEDGPKIARIVDVLENSDQRLPGGERIRARQFLQLGSQFGFHNQMAETHFLIERAAQDIAVNGRLSVFSLRRFHYPMRVTTNPIYAVLHEAIYCEREASNWSAKRMIDPMPEFGLDAPAPYFAGEMVFPWMFDYYEALKPLAEAAHELAQSEWPTLYDTQVLATSGVPVVGTTYYEDLYVDRDFALATAKMLDNCSVWITNQYEHDGLHNYPDQIIERLFAMREELITP